MQHKARKRFGQNFLHDTSVINRILAAVSAKPSDQVIEIGPGKGAITEGLVATGADVTAIEIDKDLIAYLRVAFATKTNFRIIDSDALKIDFGQLQHSAQTLRIVGNLPYNISTPLIFHLLSFKDCIHDMHFMLQKEVVERMAAKPNTKAYGRLSIMTQYLCAVQEIIDVPANCFSPAPKVRSAVVRLTPRTFEHGHAQDPAALTHVVATAFQQRRKTLANALKNVFTAEQINALGIDAKQRPDTLDIATYIRLANQLTTTRYENH